MASHARLFDRGYPPIPPVRKRALAARKASVAGAHPCRPIDVLGHAGSFAGDETLWAGPDVTARRLDGMQSLGEVAPPAKRTARSSLTAPGWFDDDGVVGVGSAIGFEHTQ